MTNASVYRLNVSDGGVPKTPLREVRVTTLGIEGDRQAKPGIHGGPYRALCLFPLEEIERLSAAGHPITPGSIGENVTTAGLDWSAVLPNARLRLGDEVVIEVTGYADPCKTITASFLDGDINQVNIRVAPVSRVYARVITSGTVLPGDAITLEAAGEASQALLPVASPRVLTQVSFAVSDLERSVAFYRDGLGLHHSRTIAEWGLAFFQIGEVTLMLEGAAHGAEANPGATTVYFAVEDIDDAFKAMSSRGVPFDAPPLIQYEDEGVRGWMALLRDPDGNKFGLVCRVPI